MEASLLNQGPPRWLVARKGVTMLREVVFGAMSRGSYQFLICFSMIAGFVKGFVEGWRRSRY